MSDGFAELFEDSPLGRTLNIPVVDTFVDWDGASFGNQGPADVVFTESANNRIVIGENGQGHYRISVASQFGASKSSLVTAAVFLNGVVQSSLTMYREIANPNDIGSATIAGILELFPGDVLTLGYQTDKMNTNLILHHINFSVTTVVRGIVPTA